MNIFSTEGRINREQYLVWMIGIAIVIPVVNKIIEANLRRPEATDFIPVYIMAWGLSVFPMAKRLHDLNKSGWFCLLSLVPLANIGLGLYLLFGKGSPGKNQYDYKDLYAFSFKKHESDKARAEAEKAREEAARKAKADEDQFFEQAYEELENGQMDKVLWAKLFAQADGDENKAKAQYIKNRVQVLVEQQED